MSDIEYSVITNDVIKSFDCIYMECYNFHHLLMLQYTKRGFTIFHVGFGVATLCLAQSRWFHGDGQREFQVNQRDSQRDEERGVIIDFREMGCFIATPCLFVSGREIPCLYVTEREIYDLLFTFAISAHGSKVQLTAYAQKPS